MGGKAFARLDPGHDVAFPLHHIQKFTGAGAKVEQAAGGFQHRCEDRPGGGARVVLTTQVLEGGIEPGQSRHPAAQQ